MPRLVVPLSTPLLRSFRAVEVADAFHLSLPQTLECCVAGELPSLSEVWTVGAIVGPSGSGKTTLARAALGAVPWPVLPPWPRSQPLIDALGEAAPDWPLRELSRLLAAVGLGSVPLWLRPYPVLSTGQQQRADLARALAAAGPPHAAAEEMAAPSAQRHQPRGAALVVIDEFSSGLDRTVACTLSAALTRWLRRQRPARRLVVLSCHDDFLPWLEPDWTLRCHLDQPAELVRGRLRRPPLRLPVTRVPTAAWSRFARHHYLTSALPAAASCFAAWWQDAAGQRPVALCVVAASLGWPGVRRIARLVTLPEFQGLGIASQLADLVASYYTAAGQRVTLTTGHPAMLWHLLRSPRWQQMRLRRRGSSPHRLAGRPIASSTGRLVASFVFVGAVGPESSGAVATPPHPTTLPFPRPDPGSEQPPVPREE